MNQLAAKSFSSILSISYVLIFLFIILMPLGDMIGTSGFATAAAKAVALVVFVLFAGMFATIISINRHLQDISLKLGATVADGGKRKPANTTDDGFSSSW